VSDLQALEAISDLQDELTRHRGELDGLLDRLAALREAESLALQRVAGLREGVLGLRDDVPDGEGLVAVSEAGLAALYELAGVGRV
jgi:hypothetical protein